MCTGDLLGMLGMLSGVPRNLPGNIIWCACVTCQVHKVPRERWKKMASLSREAVKVLVELDPGDKDEACFQLVLLSTAAGACCYRPRIALALYSKRLRQAAP